MAGVNQEIEAIGIAEGFAAALSEEDIYSIERFEELVELMMTLTGIQKDVARSYANSQWKEKTVTNNE